MTSSPFLEKAQLLIEQNRFELAQKELQQHISNNTDDAFAYALLSLCYKELDQKEEARAYIEKAVGMGPDNDMVLFFYAKILVDQDESKKAEKIIRSAISFNPYAAEYFGLLSALLISKKKFDEGLKYANQGLSIDANNLTCLNLRSMALVKTGNKDEAFSTIEGALENDPESAFTHANYGWGLLEKGKPAESLDHFREALRLEPENSWAKSGLLEALKAKNFVYRLFLRYVFWMDKMSSKAQFGVVIVIWFVYNRFTSFMFDNENLQPYLIPIWVLLILLALSTWFLHSLMNFFLRLNVYGRYALTKTQKQTSTWVGVSLGVGILGGLGYAFTNANWLGVLAIFGVVMMVPFSNMLEHEVKYKKIISISLTVGLVVLGALAMAASALTGAFWSAFSVYFLWTFLGYQVLGNVFRA